MAGLVDTNTEATPDFDAAMRAAEESAGIPSDEELYGPQFGEPPVDEAGRVPSTSPPRDDEGNPVEPPAEPAEEEAPAEEPEAVPMQPPLAEDRFAELNQKVGQMANENAEMRRRLEEYEQSQPAPQMDASAMSWFESAVEEAPDQAAMWAAQQQQPLMYERAIRAWNDVDPVAAARYERSMEWNQLQNQMKSEFAPQIAGAQRLSQDAERDAALRAVQDRHPDFDQVVGGLTEEMAGRIIQASFPEENLHAILNGSREGAEKALESLYRWVKSEQAPAMVEGAVAAVQASKEEAKAAKRAATVASATTTTPAPVEESEGERMMRVWGEQRPNMREAWKRG